MPKHSITGSYFKGIGLINGDNRLKIFLKYGNCTVDFYKDMIIHLYAQRMVLTEHSLVGRRESDRQSTAGLFILKEISVKTGFFNFICVKNTV